MLRRFTTRDTEERSSALQMRVSWMRDLPVERGRARGGGLPSPPMTDQTTTASGASAPVDERPYSPGLEGVIAAESSIGLVDGKNGRLLYRGYPIGELVRAGSVRAGRGAAVDG